MVKKEDLEYLSKEFNVPFFYTSAKTGENVESVFEKIGKLMLKKQGIKIAEN
jgi:Fe2+ transport system protein B